MSKDFYTQFILPYAGIIIKICRAYTDTEEDFQDYYQEVCLQIWNSRKNFREESKWSTWIYRISLNVCMSLLRKSKKKQFRPSDYIEVQNVPDEQNSFQDESLKLLYKAIRQLSELDRAIILLYLEEKSYKEIAAIIGTTSNNIGVRITRIKKQLKNLLDGKIY
ncbi:sigma-70 family RNA polymerase sigma factor [Salegentibacter sp. F188]|uniref:Sigma-70 family RNA polymerase sigma factor n=1 Tax=Autumnicola patrickiae TaxID=3075591 RepID=A0ABU3E1Z3_9FLAO|nr:sigma-70 family RNA polymerase sigma factor [Salegentibacter sp. F188]MDT0689292.1 sigma-70 family RNA polymerase sigma factor [Salegentibacter sp. F188]